jgi:hypothetical protein
MKHVLLFCSALFLTPAFRGQAVDSRSHPELRNAMLEGFVFEPKPKPVDGDVILVERTAQAVVDPDAVVMEKLIVSDRNLYWDLASDIKKGRPAHAQSHAKFGTGVYEKDFGKIRAFSVNVLYIPILVGVSW